MIGRRAKSPEKETLAGFVLFVAGTIGFLAAVVYVYTWWTGF
jgi:hypothetical protein